MEYEYLLNIIFMQNFVQQQVTEEAIVVESGNERVGDDKNKKEEVVDHQNAQVNIHEQMLKSF